MPACGEDGAARAALGRCVLGASWWEGGDPRSLFRRRGARPIAASHAGEPASQAKKAEETAAKAAAGGDKKEEGAPGGLEDDSTEEKDPSLYFENRVKALEAKKAKGINPYPHKFPVTSSVPDFVTKYQGLAEGEQLADVTVALAGAQPWGMGGFWVFILFGPQSRSTASQRVSVVLVCVVG
jgi:hypothetical protein